MLGIMFNKIYFGMLDFFEVIYLFYIFNLRIESCNKIFYLYLSEIFICFIKLESFFYCMK